MRYPVLHRDTILRARFFYGLTGNAFCLRCLSGSDTDPPPPEYTPVPAAHLDAIVCENCGAVHPRAYGHENDPRLT